MESNIPIDINIGKLQDWLVSRRHVNKEWQKSVLTIREKINDAIQDMPASDGIVELLSGSYINYFHCLKIVEILKETEKDSKNIFGRYGSQRMKDWLDIIKYYEKDNLYLAEAAQILVRNINYEIPSIKKQIAKQEQIQAECKKKAEDHLKAENSMRSEFLSTCKQLGIKGDKIKSELLERLQELPSIYEKVANSLKPLTPSVELYKTFKKYHFTNSDEEILPLLSYVILNGNTSIYQWSYGEPPLNIEPDPILIDIEDEKDIKYNDNQIDCGDGDNTIDFGDLDNNAGGDSIDWGNIGDSIDNQPVELAIVDDISLEESGIVVEEAGISGGTARGRDALSILDYNHTRTQFIDQLVELESFLKMRIYETSLSSESSTFTMMQELPSETVDSLTAMLDSVRVAITQIMDTKLTHLHNVKHSPRYVDVLSAQLKQKLSLCEKLHKMSTSAKEKEDVARAEGAKLRPVLSKIIEKTKEIEAEIENDISKKYKNRPVNIIGGVKYL